MNPEAKKIIGALGLEPLTHEGGFFRQTWRSAAGSAIYFLLTPEDFSAFHRLRRTDEVWHFYAGDPVEHVTLAPANGVVRVTTLGAKVLAGAVPQFVVPAGVWQGARLAPGGPQGWALLGCTLAPAWNENDFELAERVAFLRAFPGAAEQIRALTR